MDEFVLKTAGTTSDLVCDGLDAMCGEIQHGLAFYFRHQDGGWVVSFESLEELYLAAKKLRDEGKLIDWAKQDAEMAAKE